MPVYKHNYRAFGDAVLRSEWMLAEMFSRALKVRAAAEFDAARYVESGDYIDSFKVSATVKNPASGSTRRAVATVENTSDHAAMVEFGTHRIRKDGVLVTTPARHTLSRALDAAGIG